MGPSDPAGKEARSVSVDVGEGVSLEVVSMGGARPGPVLALLGRVHGDEPEGTLAIHGLLRSLSPEVLSGVVVAVPVANPAAAAAGTRESPADGRNLARVFPGRPDGTLTERIAHALVQRVISRADLLIDLHSAGDGYEFPFFVGYCDAPTGPAGRSERAAHAFGAPTVWRHPGISPGRSLSAAAELGVPSIYVEAPGGGVIQRWVLDRMTSGVRGVMRAMGMVGGEEGGSVPPAQFLDGGAGDTDAAIACSRDGYCVLNVAPGAPVDTDDALAEIVDGTGRVLEVLRAPLPATVTLVRRGWHVSAGERIVMLGPPARPL